MAINYPTSLDAWTNPTGADTLATTPHSTHHANHYDAIEALEAQSGKFTTPAPQLNGLLLWSGDPLQMAGTSTTSTAGTLYCSALWVPAPMTITNLHVYNTTNNGSANGYMALYSAAGAKLSQSPLQAMSANGFKTFALAAPQACAGGIKVYAVYWNTTAGIALERSAVGIGGTGLTDVNINLAAPNFRAASADTGITTTSPSSLGTMTGLAFQIWMGAS